MNTNRIQHGTIEIEIACYGLTGTLTVQYEYEPGAPAIIEGPSHKWAPEEDDILSIISAKTKAGTNILETPGDMYTVFYTAIETAVRKQLGIEL